MRISDWSSDFCSSDLRDARRVEEIVDQHLVILDCLARGRLLADAAAGVGIDIEGTVGDGARQAGRVVEHRDDHVATLAERCVAFLQELLRPAQRSEEHTSELQSLMRISYALFCLYKKN